MRSIIITLLFINFFLPLPAQSESDLVKIPLNDYMVGTSYNYPDQIKRAFIEEARLYLTRNGASWISSPAEYAALFEKRESGQFNGRTSHLLKVDIYQDVAYAEIEVLIPSINARFIDLILLKKFGEEWKIACKTATRYQMDKTYEGPQQKIIIEGLKKPWSMDFINENEVIIAEKDGDLVRVNLDTKEKNSIKGFPKDLFTPLKLDVSKYPKGTYPTSIDGRTVRMNAGILEVLLDPNFEQTGWIYVSYVSQKEDRYALKVIRAELVENRLNNIKTLLNPGPYVPGLYHFGGGMTFGQDAKLYITVGERLFFENLKEGLAISQDLTDQRGKIYRINPDGSIPEDNPDFGSEAVPGIFRTWYSGCTRHHGSPF